MKRRICLLVVLFYIIVSLSVKVWGMDLGAQQPIGWNDSIEIGINETYTYDVGAPVSWTIVGDESIVSYEGKKGNKRTFKGLKAGTTKAYMSLLTGGQCVLTITVHDYEAEKAAKEAEKLQQTNSYLEEIKALKGKEVPSADAKYSDVAKWVTSEYFYNDSKQLKKIAKTKDGQEKMKTWVKELNKHIRGGTKLTDTSDSTKITETNILYTAREYLNDLISTNGDSKEVDNTSDKYNKTAEKIQKIFSAALKTVTGGTNRSVIIFDDVLSNVEKYKPDESSMDANSAKKIEGATSKILTAISNVGIVVAVIMLAIIGIKYMIGSVEEKAQYKEDMLPYVIGAFILFSITGLVKILIAIGNKIN